MRRLVYSGTNFASPGDILVFTNGGRTVITERELEAEQKLKGKLMFEAREYVGQICHITDGHGHSLHSDGSVYNTAEFFPTEEIAQKVLDKFYPKPKHEWEHGDVFKRASGTVMVYLVIHGMGPVVYLLDYSGPGKGTVNACLADAKFLFNIKEKL